MSTRPLPVSVPLWFGLRSDEIRTPPEILFMRTSHTCCPGITRRSFLVDTGMGFTGLALSAMLFRDGIARAELAAANWCPPDGKPHFRPKAKSVIWIFLCGGVSHVESFDVKPELNKYAGKSIEDTPYKKALAAEGKNIVGANP